MYDVPDEAERKKGKGVFAENLKTALARGQVFKLDSNTCRGITDCGEGGGKYGKGLEFTGWYL